MQAVKEMAEIQPSTSFTIRKGTPAEMSCDSIVDDLDSDCSMWHRETPIETT